MDRRQMIQKIKALEKAGNEMANLIELADLDGDRARLVRDPRDPAIKEVCKMFGYGTVMDSAARQWDIEDKGCGHTVTASRIVLKRAVEAWKNAKKV